MSRITHFRDAALARLDGIRHGFFTRLGGVSSGVYDSLNCGWGTKADGDYNVVRNRAEVATTLAVKAEHLVTARQSHSRVAVVVETPWSNAAAPAADAMVTVRTGVALGVLSADCAPVLLADPNRRVIGAAHAGWRGAVAGVLEETVATMEQCGADRENIVAAVGPAIAQPAYEVGVDFRTVVLEEDASYEPLFTPTSERGSWYFDLPTYVCTRLRRTGIGAVDWIEHCTYARAELFFSHRRQVTHGGQADYGRQISAITLR